MRIYGFPLDRDDWCVIQSGFRKLDMLPGIQYSDRNQFTV